MRVKTFTWEEVLDMSVEELRKILDDRGQDTKGIGKPQLQRKLMGDILGKQKMPVCSPSLSRKEAVMRGKAFELKWSSRGKRKKRKEKQAMDFEIGNCRLKQRKGMKKGECREKRRNEEKDEKRKQGKFGEKRKML